MEKYEELYKTGLNTETVNPVKVFLTGLIISIVILLLINVTRFIDFNEEEKVHIGDYTLEYVGKYVKSEKQPYQDLNADYFIVYRVIGTNGVSEVITLDVPNSGYNSAVPTPEWSGVASIYEINNEERTPYFLINKDYYKVSKYDATSLVEDYWGGVWVDDLYKPLFHDETYDVSEVM